MNFAHPLALLLLVLLVPVALLYRMRQRSPSLTVGTALFWEKALAEEKFRSHWRPWRTRVSLAVQELIVVLVALAAAGPQIPASKRMVVIIDNSATMRAVDVQPTRLDGAKEIARRLVASLRDCDAMAIVCVGPVPTAVQPPTDDKSALGKAINSIQASAEPPAMEWAVKLAREISEADKVSTRIVLITDGCAREETKQAEQSGAEVVPVGLVNGNLAITRFIARRVKTEPTKCEALVEIRSRGSYAAHGMLAIGIQPSARPGATRGTGYPGAPPLPAGEGSNAPRLLEAAPFAIAAGDQWQHIFTIDIPSAAHLIAKIEPDDFYPVDDRAEIEVPAPAKLDPKSPAKDEVFSAGGRMAIDPAGGISPGLALPGQAADIRAPAEVGRHQGPDETPPDRFFPPWIVPAALAAALMVIEWCLYQRRWTC